MSRYVPFKLELHPPVVPEATLAGWVAFALPPQVVTRLTTQVEENGILTCTRFTRW